MKLRLHSAVAALLIVFGSVYGAKAAFFEPLFKITSAKGAVKIFRPKSDVPEKVEVGHVYPYGSRLIVPNWNSKMKVPEPEVGFSLSRDHRFRLSGSADLTVANGPNGDVTKKVFTLKSGKLKTFISISTVKTGGAEDDAVEAGIEAISIVTPIVVCTRLTERNEVSVYPKVSAHKIMVATESGTMEVVGPQFKVNTMRRNAAMEVFGDSDYTSILNLAADFTVELEKGVNEVEKVFFRPRSMAKIWRSYAEIGGKKAVSVMIASPDGVINSYAYMEGEKVVVDSAFVSAEIPVGGVEVIDFSDAGGDVLGEKLLGVDLLDPQDADGAKEDVLGGDAFGGFNFDDWE